MPDGITGRAIPSPGRRASAAIAAIALFGVVLLGGCSKGISDKTIAFSTLDEVRELQAADAAEPRTLVLIDPRPLRRYAEGHIPGALSVQLSETPTYGGRDARLVGHANLIVYGENPASPTARAMTKRLLAIGYTGVRMYRGGIEEWIRADLPVERSELPVDEDGELQPVPR